MGGFYSDNSIQQVRDAIDIVSVVESYFPLKKAGTRYQALCPFHNEKTPSFSVTPDMQLFKCFGCGEGGDIFKFVMKIEGLTFPEAVEVLAERVGITLHKENSNSSQNNHEEFSEKKLLYRINHIALKFFEDKLQQPQGSGALEYLKARGFTEQTISTWRLGYAPDSYDELINFISSECGERKDIALKSAIKAGLIKEGEHGRYDFFRGRVIFPILDIQHRPIAFGARILKEDKEKKVGKYLNSPETPLFSKSKVLFGIDSAAKEMRISRTAIIVEGYTDVIMCHQYGIRNVVATLGTALTHDHVRILRRYADKAIARFDADEAGLKATDKAIKIFVKEDMPLEIIRSTEIKDACEYLPKYGKDGFIEEEKNAEDAFSYHFRQCFENGNIHSIDQRAEAINKAMEVVNLSPNKIKKDLLRKKIAGMIGISEDNLPQRKKTNYQSRKAEQQSSNNENWQKTFTDNRDNYEDYSEPQNRITQISKSEIEKEKRLIEYMLAKRSWCLEICRVKPPETFINEDLRSLAADIYDYYISNKDCNEIEIIDIIKNLSTPSSSQIISDIASSDGPEKTEAKLAETMHFIEIQEIMAERNRLQQEYRRVSHINPNGEEGVTLMKEINIISKQIDLLKQKEIPCTLVPC